MLCRRYQRVDELGHDFFRLQCYFVTHFIYVMSDWGRHMLQRELFKEELVFISSNLAQVCIREIEDVLLVTMSWQVIFMEDPELTGEFIQCLRILGVSQMDSNIWPLIHHVFQRVLCTSDSSVSVINFASSLHLVISGHDLPLGAGTSSWR